MSEQANPGRAGAARGLLVNAERAAEIKKESLGMLSLTLARRQLCDLELLINGGYHPLDGFMDRAAVESVLEQARLPDGSVWPIPIVLDVDEGVAGKLEPGTRVALRDEEGFMPAVLTVGEVWAADKDREAEAVYGTTSSAHPGVAYLRDRVKPYYLGGVVEGVELPAHHEFESLWNTPEELLHQFRKMGWRKIIAFHTSTPMHKIQRRVILDAAKAHQAHVLIHPAVGETKPGDLSHFARVHCYGAMMRHLPTDLTMLSLLPLAMRMAGPREALWHALVNRNFGATHFIVGPDHASPPTNGQGGQAFYDKYQAQQYVADFAEEIGIEIIAQPEYRYVPALRAFVSETEAAESGYETAEVSEARVRELLLQGKPVPDWVSYPDVVEQLRRAYPPPSGQGITLFFTGLSGSGKSTLAKIIAAKLIEFGTRPVTLLDGDIVRQNLSKELGFSKEHRDINIRRIGYVASEITKNGGIAICAPIAPYKTTRRAVRSLIEAFGAFVEIHVSTSLKVCESRDRKGLYAKARKGIIPEFTGISDPYEVPERPELRIDTDKLSPSEGAQELLLYLYKEGFLDDES